MQEQNRARGRSHQEMRHHQQTTPSRTNIIRSEHCQINTSHQIEMEFTLIEFSPSARVYMFRSQSSLYASNRIMIMNNFYFISFNIHLKYGRMEVGKTCIRLPINRMAQTKSFNSLVEQLVGEAQNTTKRNSHTSINNAWWFDNEQRASNAHKRTHSQLCKQLWTRQLWYVIQT